MKPQKTPLTAMRCGRSKARTATAILLAFVCLPVIVHNPLGAVQPETSDESTAARPAARIEGDAQRSVPVGMQGVVKQVLLPGSELTARDVDPRTTPIIVRIDAVYPHGDTLRYDLTWFGMAPGRHDLTEFLARVDGTSTDDLPTLFVDVTSVLPDDRVEPNPPDQRPRAFVGGYQVLMVIVVLVWIAGFIAIVVQGRQRAATAAASENDRPLSRVEKIERLLNEAVTSSEFNAARKAELEGLIVGFWRDRKGLEHLTAQAALQTLRSDPDAAPLLQQLERWLYDRPSPETVDVATVLQPMKSLLSEQSQTEPAEDSSGAADPRVAESSP